MVKEKVLFGSKQLNVLEMKPISEIVLELPGNTTTTANIQRM